MRNLSPWDSVYINIPVPLHVFYINHPFWREEGGGEGVEMSNKWEGYLWYDLQLLFIATSFGAFFIWTLSPHLPKDSPLCYNIKTAIPPSPPPPHTHTWGD